MKNSVLRLRDVKQKRRRAAAVQGAARLWTAGTCPRFSCTPVRGMAAVNPIVAIIGPGQALATTHLNHGCAASSGGALNSHCSPTQPAWAIPPGAREGT